MREVVQDGVEFGISQGYTAPDERRVLEALHRDPDDHRIVRRLRRRRTREEPLGFGTGEIVGVLAAVLWVAVDEGVRTATGQAVQSLSDRLTGGLRRLFRRPAPQPELPVLTPEQLNVVAQLVAEHVRDAGVSPQQARQLAERVAGRLALGTAGELESGTRSGDGDGDGDGDDSTGDART